MIVAGIFLGEGKGGILPPPENAFAPLSCPQSCPQRVVSI